MKGGHEGIRLLDDPMTDTTANAAGPAVLEVTGLERLSLRGVDLRVAAGERVAIIGESGSGKTVLLRCLLGLERPIAGRISVFGRPVGRGAVSVRGLGVAFQQPGLFDAWSVRRNLVPDGEDGVSDEIVSEQLQRLGLDGVSLDEHPQTLSGGQQKRLAFLRAWLRGRRLLILDEPTSGLDPETTVRITRFLDASLRQDPRTLLIVTHDYRFALALCTRICLLSDGTLRDVTPTDAEAAGTLEQRLRERSPDRRADRQPGGGSRPLRWGLGATFHDFFVRGLPLSLGTMAALGAMLVAQSAAASPVDVSRWVPGVVVNGVFRELAPLVVGLLLASRIGARISAELGGMSYTAQLDSMRVLGISPVRRLGLPFAVASALTFPACIVLGALAAIGAGGLSVGAGWTGLHIGVNRYFFLARDAVEPVLVASCAVKGVLMGLAVVAVAYVFGSRPVSAAASLGRLVTGAAVLASVTVVLVDVVVSFAFFTGGLP